MAMSKKDYVKAAATVRAVAEGTNGNVASPEKALVLQRTFVDFFQASGKRFDRERFIKACGVMKIRGSAAA